MANYLPVLLVSVTTNSIPDDSSVSTLPRGQVDYLSHQWEEEDVWKSWRNMTRQKNEIANGMRLENASWRTWWKQRNKLKTVTPETLNWLKDSDVTWLYGPLHTAVEWSPPPRPKPDSTSVGKDNSAQDRLDLSVPDPNYKKPILKHRSISELLTSDLPSPLFSPAESESEDEGRRDDIFPNRMEQEDQPGKLNRPSFMHTKSDTHVTRWGPSRAFRKDSPPRVHPDASHPHARAHSHSQPYSATNLSGYFANAVNAGLSSGKNGEEVTPGSGKRRHISFNTFVEQCIAIEKPKKGNGFGAANTGGARSPIGWNGKTKVVKWGGDNDDDDDGYDEDEEDGSDDHAWHGINSDTDTDEDDVIIEQDEDEEEDDVLEMRTSSTYKRRSKSKASSSSSSSASTSTSSSSPHPRGPNQRRQRRPPLIRKPSTGDRESLHVTIAPIAPTILKTTGVGNGWTSDYDVHGWLPAGDVEGYLEEGGWLNGDVESGDGRNRTPVELVYLPPLGSNYSIGAGRPSDGGEDELLEGSDVYHHGATLTRDEVPIVGIPRSPPPIVVRTPPIVDRVEPEGEDAYDYFGGPDLGEEYVERRVHLERRRKNSKDEEREVRDDDVKREDGISSQDSGAGPVRYAEGGADDVGVRRSNSTLQIKVDSADEGLRSGLAESTKSHSRSRSRSRSRTPSPGMSPSASAAAVVLPVPVPGRNGSFDRTNSPPSALLSPPLRGRGSVSTPTESPGRGRSSTRSSPSASVSDRERSSHSSSLGSLSPDGSGLAIGIVGVNGVYGNGRADKEKDRETRGRNRGRRLSSSLSPDDGGIVLRTSSSGREYSHMAASVLSSTSEASSASSDATVVPSLSLEIPPILKSSPMSHPSPIPEERTEEEVQRSRQPTPANSPERSINMSAAFPSLVPGPSTNDNSTNTVPSSVPSPMHPSSPTSRKFMSRRVLGSTSPPRNKDVQGTIVGRAVEIVSSAGVYLGLWNGGT